MTIVINLRENLSRRFVVAVLFSLLIHALLIVGSASSHWWVKPKVVPTSQAIIVSLLSMTTVPEKIPVAEEIEPDPQLDLPAPISNSSVGAALPAEDKVKFKSEVLESDSLATPSEIDINTSSQEIPSPIINLDAAFSIARDVGKRTGAMDRGPDLNNHGGAGNTDDKIRLAVVNAWSPPPSCYRAYSGMGLFAIPFLLKDTITDSGCEW